MSEMELPSIPEDLKSKYDFYKQLSSSQSQFIVYAVERIARVEQERDHLRKEEKWWEGRRKHTQDWYARHYGELHKWARIILPEHFRQQFFNCVANGSFDHGGSTGFSLDTAQQQILHYQTTRAENAEAERDALAKALKESMSMLPDMRSCQKGVMADCGCRKCVNGRAQAALDALSGN